MTSSKDKRSAKDPVILVIHGGAGTVTPTKARQTQIKRKLEESLKAGHRVLTRGGKSLDAVEAAIKVMEDSPLFNAGKGSVFNHDGRIQMDAAVMDGSNRKAGAVTNVRVIKNPIMAARAVMERSPHVLMQGHGAEIFVKKIAREAGIDIVDPKYFWTKRRWDQLQQVLAEQKAESNGKGKASRVKSAKSKAAEKEKKFGTVGAVALDQSGNLAAGTSTGGIVNNWYGRVGDSPIIGAGTYADNDSCAVSCTGHGEFFIRYLVSHEIASLMKYKGMTVEKAADHVINKVLKKAQGEGGCIALDARGHCAMSFNTGGMYRGYITRSGKVYVGIFPD